MRCSAISRMRRSNRLDCTSPLVAGPEPTQSPDTSPASSASIDGSMEGSPAKATLHIARGSATCIGEAPAREESACQHGVEVGGDAFALQLLLCGGSARRSTAP
eukprot:6302503-Pyramimonas_sp.AAC.1